MLRWATQIHKWLGLLVALQVLGWVAGGLIMTALPIEKVRSEHHYAAGASLPLPSAGILSPAEAARIARVDAVEATVKSTLRGVVWVLKDPSGKAHVVDAATGRPTPPMGQGEARQLAGAMYQGKGRPVAARYFAEAPQESGKSGPLWRVDFDDAERTAFYLDPATGEVVSRRSNLWRFYDAFWRIHILDFGTGEDFNNPLVVTAAALTLVMVVAGIVLLWIRLTRDLRAFRARRTA